MSFFDEGNVRIPVGLMAAVLLVGGCGLSGVGRVQEARGGSAVRGEILWDADWRFLKGDCEKGERKGFDDSGWRRVDVPHDWSIEGPFDEKNPAGGWGAVFAGWSGVVSEAFYVARRGGGEAGVCGF